MMQNIMKDFMQRKEIKTLKIKSIKPESIKVKICWFLRKYEKRTGLKANIIVSLDKDGILLTKEKLKAFFITTDGDKIPYEEYKKEALKWTL